MAAYYIPQPQPPPPPPPQEIIYYPPHRYAYTEQPISLPPLPLPPHHPHHHTPLTPPPTRLSPSFASSRGNYDDDNDVRTLFIAGLPADVKNREMYHLFRDFPGFISTNLRPPSGDSQAFAFAVFSDQPSAVTAMHALNGFVFDLEEGSTLYIDLAKSNSRSKRQRRDDERTGSGKRHKTSMAFSRGSVESGLGSLHSPGMDNTHNIVGYPSAQSHLSVDGRAIFDAAAQPSNINRSTIPQDKSPCPTLFVGTLGPKCSEQELLQIFSRCQGFLKLKFQRKYGGPVAFVDFKDTACSTEALIQLQGTILNSSPSDEGIHLEYAKSRMGKRRRTSK